VNARKELGKFIKGAKKELLIYDPKISDKAMLRLIDERQKAGVNVRIIGAVSGKRVPAHELNRMRLHTRTIIRDRSQAFVGSQSLRQLELDARREIGVIFRDGSALKELVRTFEEDWLSSSKDEARQETREKRVARKKIKRVARTVAKNIAISPVAKKVARIISKRANVDLDDKKIHDSVKEIVKEVVQKTAHEAATEAAKSVV
jgi:phosphatidylserine/phosphatidylglycerophosphate/cardiolipin synthase-like enzyme